MCTIQQTKHQGQFAKHTNLLSREKWCLSRLGYQSNCHGNIYITCRSKVCGSTMSLRSCHNCWFWEEPTNSLITIQLLQLLRDCLHGATRKPYSYCTSTMQSFKSYCFSEPTIITTPKRLLHGATRKPYSYCTSTMQSFKSYCFSEPTIIATPKRKK